MVRPNLKTVLFASTLMALGVADVAFAQLGTTYDPAQLPTITGKVVQYLPTPRGDVDGLLLADGTEVQTGPAASTQIVFAVRPGDAITIHGLRARALPMVAAVSVTNDATGITVLAGPPHMHDPTQVEVQGQIKAPLHDPRGETNGVLLDDGTVIRLPPPEARRLGAALEAGKLIAVRGIGYAGALGKSVAAREIGADAAHLSKVAGPGWGMMGHEHGPQHWDGEGEGRMMRGPDGDAPPPPPPQ